MPTLPYVISGTVTTASGSVVSGVTVRAEVNNTYPNAVTDSLGHYVLDLANGSYAIGDSVIIKVADGLYFGEATLTVEVGGGKTQNLVLTSITMDTIRDKSWLVLYNHLQTGTYAISTDNIYSAMNDGIVKTIGYPIVVIEPPMVSNTKLMMNRDSIKERSVSFNIMVFANTSESVKTLADEIEASIDNGWRNLSATGLKNMQFPEGDTDWYTDGNKKVHVYNIPVQFRYVGA